MIIQRAELTDAQRADHHVRRMRILLAKGLVNGRGGDRKSNSRNGSLKSYVEEASVATGVDERTIRRDLARGKKIDPEVLAHPSLAVRRLHSPFTRPSLAVSDGLKTGFTRLQTPFTRPALTPPIPPMGYAPPLEGRDPIHGKGGKRRPNAKPISAPFSVALLARGSTEHASASFRCTTRHWTDRANHTHHQTQQWSG